MSDEPTTAEPQIRDRLALLLSALYMPDQDEPEEFEYIAADRIIDVFEDELRARVMEAANDAR